MAKIVSQQNMWASSARNIFHRDTGTLGNRSLFKSQHPLAASSASKPENLLAHKCASITYVDRPNQRKRGKVRTPQKTPEPQPGTPMKKIETHSQRLVYECPNCKRVSSGEVRVEKGRNRKRWRFIIYGVDPMPIPPPAPRPDPPSSSGSPPPATSLPPRFQSSELLKLAHEHVAYPFNRRKRSTMRRRKRMVLNAPIINLPEDGENVNCSWQEPTPHTETQTGESSLATSGIESKSSVSKKDSKPESGTPRPSKPKSEAQPCFVALQPTVPSADGGHGQQKSSGQLLFDLPAFSRKDKTRSKKSPRKQRPEKHEGVVDFEAFVLAAKAAGISIAQHRRVRRRNVSDSSVSRDGKKKRKRVKASVKQTSFSSKLSSPAQARPNNQDSGDSTKPSKTGLTSPIKTSGSEPEGTKQTNKTSSDTGAEGFTDKNLGQPKTKSVMGTRPATAELIAALIRKYRQKEREEERRHSSFPLVSRYRSYTGSTVEDTDDTSSSSRLRLASIEAVKIEEKSSTPKAKRRKIHKARSVPPSNRRNEPAKALLEKRSDSPSQADKTPKDPETLLKEFRARLQGVQGKGNIKASHIEVMAYLEGGQSRGPSFPFLPKTYQQLGLPPLIRSPSSENVLAGGLKFTSALDKTQANGEPTAREPEKPARRKQKVTKRPQTASSAVTNPGKAGDPAATIQLKGNLSSKADSDIQVAKPLRKGVRRTKLVVKPKANT